MADFGPYTNSDEEYEAIRQLNVDLETDPDNFERWEALIKACESLEGGLNRNSSPQALMTFRDAFDRFLYNFPLLFGYWKKYADMEFNIAGPESAEMVYERGCAGISISVDLWTAYCSFKMETTHDPDLVRDLFERASKHVGLDFLSHPFWDKYIEYEERQEALDRVFQIHSRVVRGPVHQYARYFDKFRSLAHSRPISELLPADALERIQAEVLAESAASGTQKSELEVERDIRTRIDGLYYDSFVTIGAEVNKRWVYESEIKRPYFHITQLEATQLSTWRKYLDFEESEGDSLRIIQLYERCVSTCALYDEFWFRYARWMAAQPGRDEDVRCIYMRAAFFVPVSRPGIRLQWAAFEESCGRVDVALDVYAAILIRLPDCVEVINSWAQAVRRQRDVDAAIQVYKDHIDAPTVDLYTKGALIADWALLLWKAKGQVEEARAVFLKNAQWYADSRFFWENWFYFELEQPQAGKESTEQAERMKHVYDELRGKSRLSAGVKRDLCRTYLDYLVKQGGKDAMKAFLKVDGEMFGPPSVAATSNGAEGTKENGATQGELDEASRLKAESQYLTFYETHTEATPDAQGLVDFN